MSCLSVDENGKDFWWVGPTGMSDLSEKEPVLLLGTFTIFILVEYSASRHTYLNIIVLRV